MSEQVEISGVVQQPAGQPAQPPAGQPAEQPAQQPEQQPAGHPAQREIQPFYDTLFRQKRKKGQFREVEPPVLEQPVADTHAHLQLLEDPALALARCAAHSVQFVCSISDVYEDGSRTFDQLNNWIHDSVELAQKIATRGEGQSVSPAPKVRIAVGCHPHNAQYYTIELEETLRMRAADTRVAAIGEIGLDFHYDYSPRNDQRSAFRAQLQLAKECELPVILHVREAHDEALAIMHDEGFPRAGTLLHCFNLDWATLQPWVEAGCYVAFGGPLTFKQTHEVREAASRVPRNRLLTETDAPFMTPEPMRGMPCGPEHVIFTAEYLARACDCAPGAPRAEFLQQLMYNARTLLDREPTFWQKEASQTLY